jgi:O-methyltransferase involved in polyketide biosynthesis
MKGNDKIAFTAQAVAFMRASENVDRFSRYFVSESIEKKYQRIKRLMPSSFLKKLFLRRINLSKDLDAFIESYKPQQIVELACGYSVRGLILTYKRKDLVYIETDFSKVIEEKKKRIKKIIRDEKIILSKNYHIVKLDAIKDDLVKKVGIYLNKNKKTLVIAETLTSYLSSEEHEFLIQNINNLLNRFNNAAYLSHEGKNKMLSGFFGKLLIIYRNLISRTKSHKHFKNSSDIQKYFKKKGFSRVQTYDSKNSGNIIYLAIK